MVWTIVGFVALAYVLLNVAVYFLQERFLFKPEKLPTDFEFKYANHQVTEHNLDMGAGVNINGVHFSVENPKGVVLYLKGNSRSIKGWGKFAIDFTRMGYDVVMVDYRGFGKSTGKRTEKGIKEDLQKVYNLMKTRVDEKYIVIYGRSMGSGFAAKLASTNHPRLVILESPYYSMKQVAKRYVPFMPMSVLLKFPIRTYKWLKHVKCPIKIIHGTKDRLIPFKSSLALSQINPKLTRLYPVIGGGHNNLHTFEEYHRFLEEIMFSKEPKPVDTAHTSLSFKRKGR
jgi:uncharacterized protein